jgi:hypothetical protein
MLDILSNQFDDLSRHAIAMLENYGQVAVELVDGLAMIIESIRREERGELYLGN